jgi:pimeloyl-ACP methyl ester carboxylesterase
VLVGHGFGAAVAAWTAIALGPVARGVVLVDGGWEDVAASSGMTPEEWLPSIEEPPEVLRSMTAFLADRRDFDPGTWDADQERAARATVAEVPAGHVVPATRRHALTGVVRALFAYRPEALAGVGAPVAILIAGEPEAERLAALDAALAQRAATGLPPATVATFPGSGHNLMRYQPEAVSAAIERAALTIGG